MKNYYCPKCKAELDNQDWCIDDERMSSSKNYIYIDYYQTCPNCDAEINLITTYCLDDEYIEID